MKIPILFAFVLLLGRGALAGSETNVTEASTGISKIKIVIKDKETNETVPCASITISGNNSPSKFQRAGLNGECELSLAPGEYDVKVSSTGFEETISFKVTAEKSKESSYNVVMEPLHFGTSRTF